MDYLFSNQAYQSSNDPSELTTTGGLSIDLNAPIPLTESTSHHISDYLFILVEDLDQNLNATTRDRIQVAVTDSITGDSEELIIYENDFNSGEFLAYLESTDASSLINDGTLSVSTGSIISVVYVDPYDSSSTYASVSVSPLSRLFNSITGELLNGITVSLMDSQTGLEATVYGDDGISTFPASITTGQSYQDSSGKSYTFSNGEFRFPYVKSGDYYFQIDDLNYSFPSNVPDEILQSLTTAPFNLDSNASRAKSFTVNSDQELWFDIPLDPKEQYVLVTKTASKRNASTGDFVQYNLSVENRSSDQKTFSDVRLIDILPNGFSLQEDSLKINDIYTDEVKIDSTGKGLEITLPELQAEDIVTISYITEIGAGVREGKATNSAYVTQQGQSISNIASASIEIEDPFFSTKAFIMGRVTNTDLPSPDNGVQGVRIAMEDGSFAITDEQGRYHFEGVETGTHVIQLDKAMLPENLEVANPKNNTRFAGSNFSQFVDLKGGSLWRADFYLKEAEVRDKQSISKLDFNVKCKGDLAHFKLELNSPETEIKNRRIVIQLPEGTRYQKNSAILDGENFNSVELKHNVMIIRLGDSQAGRENKFRFSINSLKTRTGDIIKAALLYDTPSKQNHLSSVATIQLSKKNKQNKTAQISDLVQGKWDTKKESKKEFTETQQEESLKFLDPAWLRRIGPGNKILYPTIETRVDDASVRVCVKHEANTDPEIFLNGNKVSDLNYEQIISNKEKTIWVSSWKGVDVEQGMNELSVSFFNRRNELIETLHSDFYVPGAPARAELDSEKSVLIANGQTTPVIAVRLYDETGAYARRGMVGTFSVEDPYKVKRDETQQEESVRITSASAERNSYTIQKDGLAYIELEPNQNAGRVSVNIPMTNGSKEKINAWLEAEMRDWILVGLAEGSYAYNTLSSNSKELDDADAIAEDLSLASEDRIAFYAKGQVQGKWLITAAYDTQKDTDIARRNLTDEIDPDTYYTLYADSTDVKQDASSAKKLYFKIERSQFYALFGNFNTGMSVTELSKYTRRVTGVQTQYHGDNFSLNAFVAENDQQFIKDEIRGNGTSGLYWLSAKDIIQNSETITIETRHRYQSQIILESEELTRYIDYNIDYKKGSIYFKKPIMSQDSGLNPIYIVVDYETQKLSEDDYLYGARAEQRLFNEKLSIGGSYISEESGSSQSDITGFDATLKIGNNFKINVESAESSTSQTSTSDSAAGQALNLEYITKARKVTGYYQDIDPLFGLGQQRQSEMGSLKYGVDGEQQIGDNLNLNSTAYHEENKITEVTRDNLEVGISYSFDRAQIDTGLQYVTEDNPVTGEEKESELIYLGGEYELIKNKVTTYVSREQSIGDSSNNVEDFPTRTNLAADIKINKDTSIVIEQEFQELGDEKGQITRIGTKQKAWEGAEVFSSIESQKQGEFDALFSALGINQKLKINDEWDLTASLDRSDTLSQSGGIEEDTENKTDEEIDRLYPEITDFTAVSVGAEYRTKDIEWNGRLEWRGSDLETSWGFASGTLYQSDQGHAYSLVGTIFDTDYEDGGDELDVDIRLAMAHRPNASNWMFLNRLDFVIEETGIVGSADQDEWRIVENFTSNYQYSEDLMLSAQLGLKYVEQTFGELNYDGFTSRVAFQGIYDLSSEWDLSFYGSLLSSFNAGQNEYSMGISMGHQIEKNIWLSLGYNFYGYNDNDFASANYNLHGLYMKFRMKFDQDSVKNTLKWFNKQ